jgi:soluble lytic murein transglycosylase-like protein
VTSIGTVAFGPQITAAAQRNGLDPTLLAAVAAQETGGPGANSGANVVGDGGHGHGVFQIDDRYHAFAATPAAMDPAQNADYAAGMLSGLLQKYGGDVHAALSAYNAGSPTATGTTTNWGGGTTLGYADSVMAHYAQLGGTARDAAVPELADTTTSVNQLQSLASASSSSAANAAPAVSAMPAPSLPTTQQQTQAQQSAAQAPLKQDFYADGDDAE